MQQATSLARSKTTNSFNTNLGIVLFWTHIMMKKWKHTLTECIGIYHPPPQYASTHHTWTHLSVNHCVDNICNHHNTAWWGGWISGAVHITCRNLLQKYIVKIELFCFKKCIVKIALIQPSIDILNLSSSSLHLCSKLLGQDSPSVHLFSRKYSKESGKLKLSVDLLNWLFHKVKIHF